VVEVDVPRKRIGLTMRRDGGASAREDRPAAARPANSRPQQQRPEQKPKGDDQGDFGALLSAAMKKK
ncbi:MAG: RNA-binding transcriptional accessory protein, partial [Devosia sp.]